MMNVMKSIVPEFKRVHKNLCNMLGIEENPEWVNRIINIYLSRTPAKCAGVLLTTIF